MIKALVFFLMLGFALNVPLVLASPSVDDLPDLTGGVVPVVQYKSSDPLSGTRLTSVSEVEYIVKVKNQTGDPLVADSLILVVDSVRECPSREPRIARMSADTYPCLYSIIKTLRFLPPFSTPI